MHVDFGMDPKAHFRSGTDPKGTLEAPKGTLEAPKGTVSKKA